MIIICQIELYTYTYLLVKLVIYILYINNCLFDERYIVMLDRVPYDY